MKHATGAAVCLALIVAAAGPVPAQTILVVTRETLGGQAAPRPYRSQEGFMSAMFDSGYVSFDTGPYEPEADWDGGVYDEPLAIAADGLADYLVLARIDSRLRAPASDPGVPAPLPDIHSEVRFQLLAVPGGAPLGGGEFTVSTSPAAPPDGSGEGVPSPAPPATPGPVGSTAAGATAAGERISARIWQAYERALFRVGETLARQCLPLLVAPGERPYPAVPMRAPRRFPPAALLLLWSSGP